MKHQVFVIIFLLSFIFVPSVLFADTKTSSLDEKEIIPEIKTLSNKTYEQCMIIEKSLFDFKIRHSRGIVKISYDDIPREDRVKYGYNANKVAEYNKAMKKFQEEQLEQYTEMMWRASFKDFTNNLDTYQYGTIYKKSVTVFQIIDAERFLARLPVKGVTEFSWPLVCFKGFDTKNYVDDKKIIMNGIYQVTGTLTYETVLGSSKKIFIIEPADLAK